MSANKPERAFPLPFTSFDENTKGMTLRAYFIAHAPAEPQPWFQPDVPARPDLPEKFSALDQDQRRELANFDNDGIDDDAVSEPVRAFIVRRAEAKKALAAWERVYAKARYTQWPAAWADAMIAEMERAA